MAVSMARGQFCPGSSFLLSSQGRKPFSSSSPVKLLGERQIFLHVRDEHAWLALRYEAKAVPASLRQGSQAVDLYRSALFQRFTEHTGNAAREGCFGARAGHLSALVIWMLSWLWESWRVGPGRQAFFKVELGFRTRHESSQPRQRGAMSSAYAPQDAAEDAI